MPSHSVPESRLQAAKREKQIGAAGIALIIISAVAPLTVGAGIIPTALGVTQQPGIAIGVIAVGLALMLFSVGYLAVARRIRNAGAFYSFAAHGLSKPVAVAVALVALVAYSLFQTGGYGGMAGAGAPIVSGWLGFDVPWVAIALVAWAIIAVLGQLDLTINQKVLSLLVLAETVALLLFSFALIGSPGFSWSFEPLAVSNLWQPTVGILAVIAFTSFAGLEAAAAYAEEARDAARAVSRATFGMLGAAMLVYAFVATVLFSAASSVYGSDVYQQAADPENGGPMLLFGLAAEQLGPWAVDLGFFLFSTSLLAAGIAIHSLICRYAFALGREGVIPAIFGKTVRNTPRNASRAQSAFGLVTILVFAFSGADPMTDFFFVFGTSGGLGVALLITITSFSVIGFFRKDDRGESLWARAIAPWLAVPFLLFLMYHMITNLPGLFGTDGWSGPSVTIPAVYAAAAVIGLIYGAYLRANRPEVYQSIGVGSTAAQEARGTTSDPTEVGANR